MVLVLVAVKEFVVVAVDCEDVTASSERSGALLAGSTRSLSGFVASEVKVSSWETTSSSGWLAVLGKSEVVVVAVLKGRYDKADVEILLSASCSLCKCNCLRIR